MTTPFAATDAPGPEVALPPAALEYLCVDDFLRTLVDARALKTAFELRLFDLLQSQGELTPNALIAQTEADPQGLRFLLDLLCANQVLTTRGGTVALHPAFVTALRFRDLLESKIDFAGFMLADFSDLFSAMLVNPQRFLRHARVFQLFDYGRCLDPTPENLRQAQTWMRLTSTLTRYEASACLALYDMSRHRRMLDVGGNSGEFLVQACRRHADLSGAVVDLPVVCELGLEHLLAQPESARIGFFKCDVRTAPLPTGYDLITFKSMLHDWPDEEVGRLLEQAAAALDPGGTILIFERGPLPVREAVPPYSTLPLLMFFRSYRTPDTYVQRLQALGLADVQCAHLRLDTPFFLVTARKPAP